MKYVKRSYSLPADVAHQFEQEVRPGKRSAVIGSLLRRFLEERRRERLRQRVIEGCRAMADVSRDIEQEYHPLEEEVERGLDETPETR